MRMKCKEPIGIVSTDRSDVYVAHADAGCNHVTHAQHRVVALQLLQAAEHETDMITRGDPTVIRPPDGPS